MHIWHAKNTENYKPRWKNKQKKYIDVSIYFSLNPGDTHVSMQKTQTRQSWRHLQGTAKWCNCKKNEKSEHLVCWLEHHRSCDGTLQIKSIPDVWHLHTQLAKQENSYGEVLLDLLQVHQCQETLFFFLRGCFEYHLQWVAGYSWCART